MKWTIPILLIAAALALLPLMPVACGMPDTVEEAGTPFPEFTLNDHNGNSVSKADVLGRKSVFWFYPKASTPG